MEPPYRAAVAAGIGAIQFGVELVDGRSVRLAEEPLNLKRHQGRHSGT